VRLGLTHGPRHGRGLPEFSFFFKKKIKKNGETRKD